MAKLNLTNLTNLQNETTAIGVVNSNNASIISAFENTLSRDGTSPNTMGADIDMDSNSIINPGPMDMNGNKLTGLPQASDPTDAVRLQEVGDAPALAAEAKQARDEAVEAKEDAEAAQFLSEEARDESVVAKEASEDAQSLSEDARDASILAKEASETAQGLAEGARDAAAISAGNALTSENNAHTSETNASTSEGNAHNAQIAAETAQGLAEQARDEAEAAADNFDDVYLGTKSSDPTTDNDGDPLDVGDLYFNDVSMSLKIYNGSAWQAYSAATGLTSVVDDSAPALGGDLDLNGHVITGLDDVAYSGDYGDLSNTPSLATVATTGDYDDLTDKPTLGTAAAANTGDFATATQGDKADTALQSADIGVNVQAYDARLSNVREKLTAGRTYYVRTDGSDSNDGSANDSGHAFLTIQHAVDTIVPLDIGGYSVTIQVASGTYEGTLFLSTPFFGGQVTLSGDTTTPSNVTISTTSNAVTVDGLGCSINIQGFKITTSGGDALKAQNGGNIRITGGMEFGSVGQAHMDALSQGSIICLGQAYTISGNASFHVLMGTFGNVTISGCTITLSGTRAFTAFVYTQNISVVQINSNTFSGSATGSRYSSNTNSLIQTFGAGASALPGNSAGSTGTGGLYA